MKHYYFNVILVQLKRIIKEYIVFYLIRECLDLKISINKKQSKRWGINSKIIYKSTSDKMHYVNHMRNKLNNIIKVGDCPSFVWKVKKIPGVGGIIAGVSPRIPKIQKTLSFPNFKGV